MNECGPCVAVSSIRTNSIYASMVFHWVFVPWLQVELNNYQDCINHSRKRHDRKKVHLRVLNHHVYLFMLVLDCKGFASRHSRTHIYVCTRLRSIGFQGSNNIYTPMAYIWILNYL